MWTIRYHHKGVAGVRSVSTLPLAVTAACELLAQGADVSAIDGDGDLQGIGADEIRRQCAARNAMKSK
jgi:hypothetical protein